MDTSHVSAENPQTITLSTKAKRRMRTTREETEILERFFADNTNPSNEQKIKIASIVQMGPKNVHFWFQNRRAKDNQKRKMIKENSRRLKESCSFGFHDHSQGHVYYEENRLHFKESYERLLSQQKQLETLKRTRYQKAANQLPPISTLFSQKKAQKDGVGLDIPFVFHHSIYGLEATAEQWCRATKNRV